MSLESLRRRVRRPPFHSKLDPNPVQNEYWAEIPLGHEKYAAWKEVMGMRPETAMLKYVDHVERQRARYGD